MKLTDINEIRALMERHGVHFSKSLGQNFLCAAWVPEETAENSGADERTGVLEVGAGVGCLTAELAKRAKRVVCVELDTTLAPVLAETLADFDNVEIVYGDIMKTNIPALVREKFADCERVVVCANLPYNITTSVMTAFAEAKCFETITVMVQKEAAQRICAKKGEEDYGVFPLLMQWYYAPKMLYDVAPGCFIPPPKVTSTVIRLNKRLQPPAPVRDEKLMLSIIKAAFNQRRKTLYNAMSNGLGGRFSKEKIAQAIEKSGLDVRVRGEALAVEQFAAIADALTED